MIRTIRPAEPTDAGAIERIESMADELFVCAVFCGRPITYSREDSYLLL